MRLQYACHPYSCRLDAEFRRQEYGWQEYSANIDEIFLSTTIGFA